MKKKTHQEPVCGQITELPGVCRDCIFCMMEVSPSIWYRPKWPYFNKHKAQYQPPDFNDWITYIYQTVSCFQKKRSTTQYLKKNDYCKRFITNPAHSLTFLGSTRVCIGIIRFCSSRDLASSLVLLSLQISVPKQTSNRNSASGSSGFSITLATASRHWE